MFENCSVYYKALVNQPSYNKFDFNSEIKQTLKINAAKVLYQEFRQHWASDFYPNSLGKILLQKVAAIPCALYSLLIKTIYHLGCSFFALFKRDVYKQNPVKANLYKAANDVQESWGHFLSLFDHRLGQYYLQKSTFNKACIETFQIHQKYTATLRPIIPKNEHVKIAEIKLKIASPVKAISPKIELQPSPIIVHRQSVASPVAVQAQAVISPVAVQAKTAVPSAIAYVQAIAASKPPLHPHYEGVSEAPKARNQKPSTEPIMPSQVQITTQLTSPPGSKPASSTRRTPKYFTFGL